MCDFDVNFGFLVSVDCVANVEHEVRGAALEHPAAVGVSARAGLRAGGCRFRAAAALRSHPARHSHPNPLRHFSGKKIFPLKNNLDYLIEWKCNCRCKKCAITSKSSVSTSRARSRSDFCRRTTQSADQFRLSVKFFLSSLQPDLSFSYGEFKLRVGPFRPNN